MQQLKAKGKQARAELSGEEYRETLVRQGRKLTRYSLAGWAILLTLGGAAAGMGLISAIVVRGGKTQPSAIGYTFWGLFLLIALLGAGDLFLAKDRRQFAWPDRLRWLTNGTVAGAGSLAFTLLWTGITNGFLKAVIGAALAWGLVLGIHWGFFRQRVRRPWRFLFLYSLGGAWGFMVSFSALTMVLMGIVTLASGFPTQAPWENTAVAWIFHLSGGIISGQILGACWVQEQGKLQ